MKGTLTIVDQLFKDKKLSRYVAARWNSRYKSIKCASEKQPFDPAREPSIL